MSARSARLVRGWTGAFAATLIAAASHTVSGGLVPALPVLALALALSGLVCTILAGQTLSLWRLITAVVISQGLFHGLFSMGAGGDVAAAQIDAMSHAAHGMPDMVPMKASDITGSSMDHSSPVMWIGHSIAAVLTILFLRCGEAAGVRLVEAIKMRVTALLPVLIYLIIEVERPRVASHRQVRPVHNLGVPLLVMRHRGPPAPAIAP